MNPKGAAAAGARGPGKLPGPPAPDVRPALDGPLEGFLDELRAGRRLSGNTVDAYARDLADYRAFALRHGLAGWSEVTPTFVDGYFALLLKRGLSGATVARRRSALRGFHAWLAAGLG